LKSITPAPDFGPNLKLTEYEQEIDEFSADLDNYNKFLSTLDEMLNALQAKERRLHDKNKRMLAAADAQYGSDSSQYEQAGGTRDSESKSAPKKSSSKS
jgi:hypothetical protein